MIHVKRLLIGALAILGTLLFSFLLMRFIVWIFATVIVLGLLAGAYELGKDIVGDNK